MKSLRWSCDRHINFASWALWKITWSAPTLKCMHNVPTDRFAENMENVMSSICANRAEIFPNFKRLPFHNHQFVFRVLYAITIATTSPTRLLMHVHNVPTAWFAEIMENVMSSICANRAKTFPNFKRLPFCNHLSVFRVTHTATLSTHSSTCFHMHVSHVPTDRCAENMENVMSSVCADRAVNFPTFKLLPFRTHLSVFCVTHTAAICALSCTRLLKCVFHFPTDRFDQTTENVMSSVCADRAVNFPNFKWLPFRTHQFVFSVLYAISFRMTFSICVIKHTWHTLTKPSNKQNEYIITSLFFAHITIKISHTCKSLIPVAVTR
jgi:hypothetical protein